MILRSNIYVASQCVCYLYINPRVRQFVTLTLAQKSARRISMKIIHKCCTCNLYINTPHEGNVRQTPHEGNVRQNPHSGKAHRRWLMNILLDPHDGNAVR